MLSKYSEPHDKSSTKGASNIETGLGWSASLDLSGDSISDMVWCKGTSFDDPADGSWNIEKDLNYEKFIQQRFK